MRLLGALIILVVISVLLVATGWWNYYKYQDCLKVGHSKLYCVGKVLEGSL